MSPSPADYSAAAATTNVHRHALRANTPEGHLATAMALSTHPANGARTADPPAPDSDGRRYPADLEYHGEPVAVSMESHAIYLHPNGSCSMQAIVHAVVVSRADDDHDYRLATATSTMYFCRRARTSPSTQPSVSVTRRIIQAPFSFARITAA